ncbi:hypothetical protein LLH06_06180 [Mucilaginibacter daejeonensis]|uniref:hypothetical protein n=1 Tax=Mucilaginibacter daejeonensis TaxID=398049 RepID=UPI001D17A7CD|nr:hypothetical protein [Mucilaginibacter daejeonensis]UEG54547.1 hypothetical protein LLH06_06180 [Mucilaginibacter daejeonensis]
MIQKTLSTLNGKLQVSIPQDLHELTLGQLMAMQATDNMTDIQAIQILSGVPMAELQQVRSFHELQVFNDHILALAQQIRSLYNSDNVPKTVSFHIKGKTRKVNVSANLSMEPAGAFMAARDIIAEEVARHAELYGDDWQEHFDPSLRICSQILAHYFYCRATGELYNEEKATAFAEEVEKLPITQALPIAKCFFLSYPSLSKPRTGFWRRLFRSWRKGPVSPSSRSSDISTLLTHWQGVM